jgi:hypothetical protein
MVGEDKPRLHTVLQVLLNNLTSQNIKIPKTLSITRFSI